MNRTLISVIIAITIKTVYSLKCYQCTSMNNRDCVYNVNLSYLRPCEIIEDMNPVCRFIYQVQLFTETNDVTVVRECAYVYTKPLRCGVSHLATVHHSQWCECDTDACNFATKLDTFMLLCITAALISVIK